MKVEHVTTIILETEKERQDLLRALCIVDELTNRAIRDEGCPSEFVRAGLDDVRALSDFRDSVKSLLEEV